jgi:hypothetical protein
METIEVTVIPEDFRGAPMGYKAPYCVLHMTLKRLYPDRAISVGSAHVFIGESKYNIDLGQWGIGNLIDGFSHWTINELSEKAKKSLEGIPSKTLYLYPSKESMPVFSGPDDPRIA